MIDPARLTPDPEALQGAPFTYREDRGTGILENAAGHEVVFYVIEDTEGLGETLRKDPGKSRLLQPWPCPPETCGSAVTLEGSALVVRVHCRVGDLHERRIVTFDRGTRGAVYATAPTPEDAEANAALAHRALCAALDEALP